MNEKDFLNLCKKAVAEYSNEHLDKSDGKKITEDDVFYRLDVQDLAE